MNKTQPKYWRSLAEWQQEDAFREEASREFKEELPLEEILGSGSLSLSSNRRDFLKFFGFGMGAVTLAACTKAPVKKAIPFVNHPEEMSPSLATWYATTYYDGYDYASVLVKTREGRPIKLEGNALSPISQGGVNARVHASLLSLYDTTRYKSPRLGDKSISWSEFDQTFTTQMEAAAGRPVVMLTNSVVSPTTRRLMTQMLAKYPNLRWVSYDAISASGMLEANEVDFGQAALPSYRFAQARVVLGIDADFLGNWLMPVAFTRDYTKNRKINPDQPEMSRHIQFESRLSVTGSNADVRATYRASQEAQVVANLYNAIAKLAGQTLLSVPALELAGNSITQSAAALWKAKGQALVVCGSNDPKVQRMVNGINHMLGSYGNTIDWSAPMSVRQGRDKDMEQLMAELKSGATAGLIVCGVNPVYDHPRGKEWGELMKKATVSVALATQPDETAVCARLIGACSHFLESWGDAEPVAGQYSLQQPAISRLYDTRSLNEWLLQLSGSTESAYDALKSTWNGLASASGAVDAGAFWRTALHNGVYSAQNNAGSPVAYKGFDSSVSVGITAGKTDGLDLVLYEKLSLGNGAHASNPWLQEMPDPISKACWDNYLAVNVKTARENNWKDGDMVKLTVGSVAVEVPILVQPGMHPRTVALAVGYGRSEVGVNAFAFVQAGNHRSSTISGVQVIATGQHTELAQTQTHHTIEGRNIVKETHLDRYVADHTDGNVRPYVTRKKADGTYEKVYPGKSRNAITLWQDRDYEGHHWAMAVDLNACTGCGACVVSCQVENNVPVVGKQEVINRREMHWIRIDRYYAFVEDGERIDKETDYDRIGTGDQVDVVFQPVMCMQCDNAPCETVCPVLATVHSDEGLNQMVYNRCVGTRYCANNCPYKVRRFNWFSYIDNPKFNTNPSQTDLGRMVLNPDVTVRARGVMEKCTFCVQRIQAGKLDAKREGRGVGDGEIKTACQQSCPAGAIVFGDLNDPESEVSRLFLNERSYGVIEELNVLPSVNYLTKVRNRDTAKA
ncbi:MAG: 4Fe-4S dicluster domain-containing protein [Bacteroidetes bacterium]|nr:4Fe-4S dicluster domain-containing protein [Bacteroidota bacterium]